MLVSRIHVHKNCDPHLASDSADSEYILTHPNGAYACAGVRYELSVCNSQSAWDVNKSKSTHNVQDGSDDCERKDKQYRSCSSSPYPTDSHTSER